MGLQKKVDLEKAQANFFLYINFGFQLIFYSIQVTFTHSYHFNEHGYTERNLWV